MKGSNVILCPNGGGHPAVDRVRSAHYNDIAIVLPYLLVVPIWLNTLPSFFMARTIMLCFATSNLLSTLMHLEVLEAPDMCRIISRACSYTILAYICFACMGRYLDLPWRSFFLFSPFIYSFDEIYESFIKKKACSAYIRIYPHISLCIRIYVRTYLYVLVSPLSFLFFSSYHFCPTLYSTVTNNCAII